MNTDERRSGRAVDVAVESPNRQSLNHSIVSGGQGRSAEDVEFSGWVCGICFTFLLAFLIGLALAALLSGCAGTEHLRVL
jgi:hypothetical protein